MSQKSGITTNMTLSDGAKDLYPSQDQITLQKNGSRAPNPENSQTEASPPVLHFPVDSRSPARPAMTPIGRPTAMVGQADGLSTLVVSEKPYRMLIEAMKEGALTLLSDGTVLYCNPRFAEMMRTPIQRIIGRSFFQFLNAGEGARLKKHLGAMPPGGMQAEFTLTPARPEESQLPALLSLRSLHINGVGTFAVVATDLSERKQYEKELQLQKEELEWRVAQRTTELTEVNSKLRAAQDTLRSHAKELKETVESRTAELEATVNSLEQFCYSIAHDLRAPLRTMHGFASAMLDDFGPQLEEGAQDYAQRIIAAATRMDEQIRALLAYGRLNSSEMTLVPVDPAVLLQELASLDEFKKATIQIQEPLHRVLANPIALRQVFDNLLGNAVKFVTPGLAPHICIASTDQETSIRLSVQDNGIGIDPKYHTRIFNVFERVAGPAYPGTGIGLAIVQKGMERMGGCVGVESAPGKGSLFWIELKKPDLVSV